MFRRPALYHPYRSPPGAGRPAGFRFADIPRRCLDLFQGINFTDHRSPVPSPLSSPVKDPNDLSSARFPGYYPRDVPESPVRPSSPTPGSRQQHVGKDAPAPEKARTVHAKPSLPRPHRRKAKYAPRQPKPLSSFRAADRRSGAIPVHRRSQVLKEKREAFRRKLNRNARASRSRKTIDRMLREAEALMDPDHMGDEDQIFLEQLANMDIDHKMEDDLDAWRGLMARAAKETEERRREHEKMDEEAARLWDNEDKNGEKAQKQLVAEFMQREDAEIEAHNRQIEAAAMRADEVRRRAHEAAERKIREEQERIYREDLARKAYEEKISQEAARLTEQMFRLRQEARERRQREAERARRAERAKAREEQERKIREEAERLERAERARAREEQERKIREEAERLQREAHERFLREERERAAKEERERQARRATAEEEQVRQAFWLYEAKWNELRTSNSIPPIDYREMPWPVFFVVSSVVQITHQDVRAFLFHPLRPGVEGKSARDKVKSEVLRFHPDKFNTRMVPKIQEHQQAVAQEIAGAVARILTTIMTEEGEQK